MFKLDAGLIDDFFPADKLFVEENFRFGVTFSNRFNAELFHFFAELLTTSTFPNSAVSAILTRSLRTSNGKSSFMSGGMI